jgi:hypothetical protein
MSEQQKICAQYGADYLEAPLNLKLGISRCVRDGLLPVNGLRHLPVRNTTGWYIWAGEEFSQDSDFFMPLHVEHIIDWCPYIGKYLGLAPGWRFIATPEGYEDVWFDGSILE